MSEFDIKHQIANTDLKYEKPHLEVSNVKIKIIYFKFDDIVNPDTMDNMQILDFMDDALSIDFIDLLKLLEYLNYSVSKDELIKVNNLK